MDNATKIVQEPVSILLRDTRLNGVFGGYFQRLEAVFFFCQLETVGCSNKTKTSHHVLRDEIRQDFLMIFLQSRREHKPLVQTTRSFITDTTHFLDKLEQLGQLPNNAFLVTLDVSSLCTNIPTTKALTPVDTSSTHATTTLPLSELKLFVTSYA